MDSNKRTWIYAGLALAAGVGLVSMIQRDAATAANPVIPPSGPAPTGGKPPVVLSSGDRVLLVGDSLAQGLTAPLKQLATDLGVKLVGDGRVSTLIGQWASQPWLAADLMVMPGPKFVLVSLGTNDMKLFAPASEQAALVSLMARLRASGAIVVWLLPPTMPFADAGVRAMIASSGAVLFHSEALTIPRGPDKIHPTTLGYAGWAGAIWAFLRRGILLV